MERENMCKLKMAIVDRLVTLDLPMFMLQDTLKTIENLNYYKMNNLYKNMDHFIDFLQNLKSIYLSENKKQKNAKKQKLQHAR